MPVIGWAWWNQSSQEWSPHWLTHLLLLPFCHSDCPSPCGLHFWHLYSPFSYHPNSIEVVLCHSLWQVQCSCSSCHLVDVIPLKPREQIGDPKGLTNPNDSLLQPNNPNKLIPSPPLFISLTSPNAILFFLSFCWGTPNNAQWTSSSMQGFEDAWINQTTLLMLQNLQFCI